MELTLPGDVTLKRFKEDIMIMGPNLSQRRFQKVLALLSKSDRQRVIGWSKTARKIFC